MQFTTTLLSVAVAFAAVVMGSPITNESTEVSSSIISEAQLAHWLATTDAELTFIGERPNPLKRSAQTGTTVMYCTKRIGPICGGSCTVYTGGATCLDATGTTCISSTKDIGFCDQSGCNGNCNALSMCGTPMGNGFCFTPQTESILVSPL